MFLDHTLRTPALMVVLLLKQAQVFVLFFPNMGRWEKNYAKRLICCSPPAVSMETVEAVARARQDIWVSQ